MTTKQTSFQYLNNIQEQFDNLIKFLWENRTTDKDKDAILDYLDNTFCDLTHEINKAKNTIDKL